MYHIVPISSFNKAKEFAPYCDWCICQAEFDYETYTKTKKNNHIRLL